MFLSLIISYLIINPNMDIVYSYTLDDFYGIIRNGFESSLNPETITLLKNIETSLGLSESSEPPVFHPTTTTRNSYKPRVHQNSTNNRSSGWSSTVERFKTTKIEKKEGVEQKINEIRVALNKISNKNYDTQRDTILQIIVQIGDDDLEKIANAIFDIASTNKFYSEMYANLYKELMTLYPVFSSILDQFLNGFSQKVTDWKYVDPNTSSYDEVSQYNKKNDCRKATAVFLVHLMKKEIISISAISQIVEYLQGLLLQYIDEPNKTNEIEEITELLFLFISEGFAYMKQSEDSWNSIFEKVESFSKIVRADKKPSYTSRSVFKHMDIISVVNGKKK